MLNELGSLHTKYAAIAEGGRITYRTIYEAIEQTKDTVPSKSEDEYKFSGLTGEVIINNDLAKSNRHAPESWIVMPGGQTYEFRLHSNCVRPYRFNGETASTKITLDQKKRREIMMELVHGLTSTTTNGQ